MRNETTVVLTYRSVDNYTPAIYGNGRVIIIEKTTNVFAGKTEAEISDIKKSMIFECLSLIINKEVKNVFIYLGQTTEKNLLIFNVLFYVARSLTNNDTAKITIVGCHCNANSKIAMAHNLGCNFLRCECGGGKTLRALIEQILKETPEEPKSQRDFRLKLKPIFTFKNGSNYNSFINFAVVNGKLFAGCSSGEVFVLESIGWKKTRLKMKQGINVMFADGSDLLVGDGSCCCGGVKRLSANGRVKKITPIKSQAEKNGDLRGNVHGIIRYKNRLLAGVGGCSGSHVYILENDRWQYLDNDPKKYVNSMFVDSRGTAYFSMGSEVYLYDGKFKLLGNVASRISQFFEFQGKVYMACTDFGSVLPTHRSQGHIYEIAGENIKNVWNQAGGVERFFTHQNELYAYGRDFRYCNLKEENIDILKLQDGNWQLLTSVSKDYKFFSFENALYAGSFEGEGENKRPTIFQVELK